MKRSLVAVSVALIALGGILIAGGVSAQEGPPPPTSGTLLSGEVGGATGAAIGPDGALYVPQGGTGGDQVLDPPAEAGFDGEVTFGLTASIVRIDPETGAVTTEAENLPSVAQNGEGGGLADVEFIGGNLYFLLTGSADKLGVPAWPNGVYRVTNNGTDADLIANISEFNDDNPVDFADAAPGGNPFALEQRGNGFVVSDGNYNRLLSVSSSGTISLIAEFDNVVPTGLALGSSGAILNTWFSPEPHAPGGSFVVSVATGGAVTELATGPTSMIDVSIGSDGKTYVLQFSDFVADESAPPEPTGSIYRLDGSALTLLVDGFPVPTSLDFAGDTAFVTTLFGGVWKIEDFSSIDPLPAQAPEPTAAPPTVAPAPVATPSGGSIGAPDTGYGPDAEGDATSLAVPLAIIAALVFGSASIVIGGALARKAAR